MPDREWFIRAIEAEPKDDGIRLAFSDWLEENGDEDRARFIRLQCEHHRLYALVGRGNESPHRLETEKEIDRLLRRHREAWTAGVPEWARNGVFQRGFLNAFQMTGKQFLDDADALRAVGPLDIVSLRRMKGREAAVFASEHLAGVSRLWAEGAQLTDAGVAALVASPHLGRVRELDLGRSVLGDADEANKLTDASATALAGADNLPVLMKLGLSGYRKITGVGIRTVVESECLSGLKGLDVSGSAGGPPIAELFRGPAFRLTAIKELGLSRHNLGDAGAGALADAPALRGLRLLSLTQNKIGDRGASALAASPYLGGLVSLDLWKNKLTDAGVLALLASPVLRGVRRLQLGENPQITDASARAILDDPRPWGAVGLEGTQTASVLLKQIAARCASAS